MLSLMMVTFNRLDLTKQTLDNLFKTTTGDYNLIIIDNGSEDGTREYLSKLSCPLNVKLTTHLFDKNRGIARGRNKGLQLADSLNTEWYATIDNDILCPHGWNEDCINILKNNKNFGMMGVNMEDSSYPLVTKGGYTFQEKPRGNLGTACIVFHKSLHRLLGFFNTEYNKLYGEEDADFGMRCRVLGLKMGYIKENGTHLGVGENDTGAYREFKTKCHKENLALFNKNCGLYYARQKPIFIPYKD